MLLKIFSFFKFILGSIPNASLWCKNEPNPTSEEPLPLDLSQTSGILSISECNVYKRYRYFNKIMNEFYGSAQNGINYKETDHVLISSDSMRDIDELAMFDYSGKLPAFNTFKSSLNLAQHSQPGSSRSLETQGSAQPFQYSFNTENCDSIPITHEKSAKNLKINKLPAQFDSSNPKQSTNTKNLTIGSEKSTKKVKQQSKKAKKSLPKESILNLKKETVSQTTKEKLRQKILSKTKKVDNEDKSDFDEKHFKKPFLVKACSSKSETKEEDQMNNSMSGIRVRDGLTLLPDGFQLS